MQEYADLSHQSQNKYFDSIKSHPDLLTKSHGQALLSRRRMASKKRESKIFNAAVIGTKRGAFLCDLGR